jgi:hypothetical protein
VLGEDFGMHAAQVVPTEVMMQREKCFNAATRDWEFFELDEQTSARELAAVAQNVSVKRFELVHHTARCFEFPHRLDPEVDSRDRPLPGGSEVHAYWSIHLSRSQSA